VTWALLRTIVILPGTVLVFVPAAILWASAGTDYAGALAGPGKSRSGWPPRSAPPGWCSRSGP
jgi:hypothetical protein